MTDQNVIQAPSAGEPEWQGDVLPKLDTILGGLLIPNQAMSKALARKIKELNSLMETAYLALVSDIEGFTYMEFRERVDRNLAARQAIRTFFGWPESFKGKGKENAHAE